MILLWLAACATDSATCDSAAVSWDNFTAGFIAGRCQSCHGSGAADRHGAPESVTFDTEAEVVDQAEGVRDSVLERQSMPPAGGLTDTERERLADWLACPG